MPDIKFGDICPTCKGVMATGNRFCRLACYDAQSKLKEGEDDDA